jgi:hypothetical protein
MQPVWKPLELCKHDGERLVDKPRGHPLLELQFCLECGQPVFNSILDMWAFIRKPRRLQNGKVVSLRLSTFSKLDAILENIRIIAYRKPRGVGRPKTKADVVAEKTFKKLLSAMFEDEESMMEYPSEKDSLLFRENPETGELEPVPHMAPFGPVGIKKYRKEYNWAIESNHLFTVLWKMYRNVVKNEKNWVIFPAIDFLMVAASVGLDLTIREVRAVVAAGLVIDGKTFEEAKKITGVKKNETIKNWLQYVKRVHMLANAMPELTMLERDPSKRWRLCKRMPDGTVKTLKMSWS